MFFEVLLSFFGLVAVVVGGDSGNGGAGVFVRGGGLDVSERRGADTSTLYYCSNARTSYILVQP